MHPSLQKTSCAMHSRLLHLALGHARIDPQGNRMLWHIHNSSNMVLVFGGNVSISFKLKEREKRHKHRPLGPDFLRGMPDPCARMPRDQKCFSPSLWPHTSWCAEKFALVFWSLVEFKRDGLAAELGNKRLKRVCRGGIGQVWAAWPFEILVASVSISMSGEGCTLNRGVCLCETSQSWLLLFKSSNACSLKRVFR